MWSCTRKKKTTTNADICVSQLKVCKVLERIRRPEECCYWHAFWVAIHCAMYDLRSSSTSLGVSGITEVSTSVKLYLKWAPFIKGSDARMTTETWIRWNKETCGPGEQILWIAGLRLPCEYFVKTYNKMPSICKLPSQFCTPPQAISENLEIKSF
jgi:hypothetical protein